jgi:hypothetical protein
MRLMAFFAFALALGLETADAGPAGVSRHGPLRLGHFGPVQPGQPTAMPHARVPRSKFYVFVVQKGIPAMCTFEDCGAEGELVEKLGGWITGDDQAETISLAGLDESKVRMGQQSIVVVANSSGRVVGIYPSRTMKDVPEILQSHRALWAVKPLRKHPGQ